MTLSRFSAGLLLAALVVVPSVAAAKSYVYERIDVELEVSKDSTVDVTERQTYRYDGRYTKGWRSISLRGIGAVTDVRVRDGETGEYLTEVNDQLNQHAPSSKGKFTTFRQGGGRVVEWYYDLEDTTHTWVIEYTAHGAVRFLDEKDELYWNLFTDYDVPVRRATAEVILPERVGRSALDAEAYTDLSTATPPVFTSTGAQFATRNVPPGGAFTVALGFPKEIVSEKAYWMGWLKRHYGIIGSLLVVLLGVIVAAVRWYVTERYNAGRGTVVPHYEPPQDIPPAMAEAVVNEKVSKRTWPATLVDLAERRYVEIREAGRGYNLWWSAGSGPQAWIIKIVMLFPVFFLVLFLVIFVATDPNVIWFAGGLLVVGAVSWSFIRSLIQKHYAVTLTQKGEAALYQKEQEENDSLEDYERAFLDLLFSHGFNLGDDGAFTTHDLRFSGRRKEFAKKFKKLKEKLYKEIDSDLSVYENSLAKNKYVGWIAVGVFFAVMIVFQIGIPVVISVAGLLSQAAFVVLTAAVVGIALYVFFRYEARLSERGQEIREQWLGFKMYLETAEKYRLQNLTPETFHRFLPYAMIFGVEKKWARAFETLNITAPDWYHGHGAYAAGAVAGSGSGFSPTGFSSSFSSSFSSAFASSGGGGASGGGGGAGGGAGGGGGGAS